MEETVTVYTFDEICESQDFSHDQEFVSRETYNTLLNKLLKARQHLKECMDKVKSPDQYMLDETEAPRFS